MEENKNYHYFKLTTSYNGGCFFGWQSTLEGTSVQSTIEEAISKAHGGGVYRIYGASRTDRGVHAYMQCFTLKSDRNWPTEQLKRAINFYLNNEQIVILSCEITTITFSSRHNSKSKTYHYQVYLNDVISPLLYPYFFLWYKKVNLDLINEAVNYIKEAPSLNGFAHNRQELKNDYTLQDCSYVLEDKKLTLIFKGKGFFHHEIRFIAYHILQYISNLINIDDFQQPILNPTKLYKKKILAPPQGLFLMNIEY